MTNKDYDELMADYRKVVAERDRLQRIIDCRPAINAGLPHTYIEWSQSIYALDMARLTETAQ